MNILTIKIPQSLERELTRIARRNQMAKSEVVRRAVEQFIARDKKAGPFQSALELAAGLVGSVKGAPADLAFNLRHMEDYGR
jgi:predicted transcriptional regulator